MPVVHEVASKGPSQAVTRAGEPADASCRHRLLRKGGHKYLLMMDHFSGMQFFEKLGIRTDNEHTVKQLKRWFATFGTPCSIRCDNGPPMSSNDFEQFCKEYGIQLKLTAPYNPESSGAAERGVGLVKAIMKKTEEEGSCMEEHPVIQRSLSNGYL